MISLVFSCWNWKVFSALRHLHSALLNTSTPLLHHLPVTESIVRYLQKSFRLKTSANQIKGQVLSDYKSWMNEDYRGGRKSIRLTYWSRKERYVLPSSERSARERSLSLNKTASYRWTVHPHHFFFPLCSGALRPQALVALCGVSGSDYCQRQLLDWVGKQPIYISPQMIILIILIDLYAIYSVYVLFLFYQPALRSRTCSPQGTIKCILSYLYNKKTWDALALFLFALENSCSGWFGLIAPRWRLLSALSNEQAWQCKIPCHYDECLRTARSVCCIKTAPLCQTNVYSKLSSLSSSSCKVTDATNLPIT